MLTKIIKWWMLIVLLIVVKPCYPNITLFKSLPYLIDSRALIRDTVPNVIAIDKNISIEHYFQFLDSIVTKYDSITPYHLTEHLLARANPWIIDTLQNTDYYRMMEHDSFVYNQKKMIVLPKGASLVIPDAIVAQKILDSFQNTWIDINIPEFKLRIYEGSKILYEFPIRVGRNEEKYLETYGRVQNLRTKTGEGFIVGHIRNPKYVNPVTDHEYFVTKRDDGNITKLPQIPFIIPEIEGKRSGQIIHPTTNPITLGKAYSNGCIGTKEADAWVIYYHAPIGTKIIIRYDLNVHNENGNEIVLKDIYNKTQQHSH